MRFLHVIAGLLGLASGALALYALKGAKLHRQSGMIFVYSMLFLSASGAVMAALKSQRVNTIAGVLTSYLVATALLIAINSSFLGQPKVFPKPLRDAALQATPVLLVSAVMLYWLARVLFAQRHSRA
jgi:uncharacterized membrane protein